MKIFKVFVLILSIAVPLITSPIGWILPSYFDLPNMIFSSTVGFLSYYSIFITPVIIGCLIVLYVKKEISQEHFAALTTINVLAAVIGRAFMEISSSY